MRRDAARRSRRGSTPRTRRPGSCRRAGEVVAYREPRRACASTAASRRAREVGTDYDPMLAKVVAHGRRPRRGAGAAAPRARRAGRRRPDHERRLPARPAGPPRGARRGDRHRPDRAPRRRGRGPRPPARAGGAGAGRDARRARGRRHLVGPQRLAPPGTGVDPPDAGRARRPGRGRGPRDGRPPDRGCGPRGGQSDPPSIADAIAIRSAIEGGSAGAWEWKVGEDSGVLTYDGTDLGVGVDGPKTR